MPHFLRILFILNQFNTRGFQCALPPGQPHNAQIFAKIWLIYWSVFYVPDCITMYCNELYYTTLYCGILYCTVIYSPVSSVL